MKQRRNKRGEGDEVPRIYNAEKWIRKAHRREDKKSMRRLQ